MFGLAYRLLYVDVFIFKLQDGLGVMLRCSHLTVDRVQLATLSLVWLMSVAGMTMRKISEVSTNENLPGTWTEPHTNMDILGTMQDLVIMNILRTAEVLVIMEEPPASHHSSDMAEGLSLSLQESVITEAP